MKSNTQTNKYEKKKLIQNFNRHSGFSVSTNYTHTQISFLPPIFEIWQKKWISFFCLSFTVFALFVLRFHIVLFFAFTCTAGMLNNNNSLQSNVKMKNLQRIFAQHLREINLPGLTKYFIFRQQAKWNSLIFLLLLFWIRFLL